MTPQVPEVEIYMARVAIFESVWSDCFHTSGKFELSHILSGAMTLELADKRRYPLKAGDTFILPPEQSHRDVFQPTRDLKVLLLHFSWDNAAEYAEKIDFFALNKLPAPTRSEIRWLLAQIRNDLDERRATDKLLNNLRLANILLLFYRDIVETSIRPVPYDPGTQMITEAQLFIERNLGRKLHLDDVAGHLGISPFHLAHQFREHGNFTFVEYLTQLRLERAKKMLLDRHLHVSEVANRVGFDSPHYFAKVFKRKLGVTPNEFRASQHLEPSNSPYTPPRPPQNYSKPLASATIGASESAALKIRTSEMHPENP